jgi:ribosomal protein S12 methylthiotransferase
MKLISMISLGCPKNLVDSETILGILASGGYVVTPSPEDAEIILINTCGFIEPAVREAVDTIIHCLQLKAKGLCSCVVVLYLRKLQFYRRFSPKHRYKHL